MPLARQCHGLGLLKSADRKGGVCGPCPRGKEPGLVVAPMCATPLPRVFRANNSGGCSLYPNGILRKPPVFFVRLSESRLRCGAQRYHVMRGNMPMAAFAAWRDRIWHNAARMGRMFSGCRKRGAPRQGDCLWRRAASSIKRGAFSGRGPQLERKPDFLLASRRLACRMGSV